MKYRGPTPDEIAKRKAKNLARHNMMLAKDAARQEEPDVEAPVPKGKGSTTEPREQQAAVIIPGDWSELSWPKLRQLASKVSNDAISNRDAAVAAIEAELERRKAGQ